MAAVVISMSSRSTMDDEDPAPLGLEAEERAESPEMKLPSE
jgi:hypothetical protein